MNARNTFGRVAFAAILLVSFLFQETWALAGTTGSLSGTLLDDSGKPLAAAQITATSTSQSSKTQTDGSGHFVFLSLTPDTYTVSASKEGMTPVSLTGISVFADNAQVIALRASSLKTIASVTSRAAGNLIKPGTTADVYAINTAAATQLKTLGGGNNLDSALSAIYGQPGVNALPGNYGFGQVFYIHGSSYNQIGYEFDGVPVNRAFDNYNASSLSNLGTSETEVYTSGAPSTATSATLGGYINQVIKNGTYPGFGSLTAALGAPGFYHKFDVEAGGASPNRMFSYYVGLRGADSVINTIDSKNAGGLNPDGSNAYGIQSSSFNANATPFQLFGISQARGPWSTCNADGTTPANGSFVSPALTPFYGLSGPLAACNTYAPIYGALTVALRGNQLSDRESVANFHFAIPHKNDEGRDDVQILFDNFYYQTLGWDNISTNGGLPLLQNALGQAGGTNGTNGLYGAFLTTLGINPAGLQTTFPQYPGVCSLLNLYATFGVSNPCAPSGPSPLPYRDASMVNGATFGQLANTASGTVQPYFFPASPSNRAFGSGVSPYAVGSTLNNGSIIKLQYQKNMGSSAYLRVYGYGFYSDWLQKDPSASVYPFLVGASTNSDYDLYTRTFGGEFTYANQINSKNLITFSGSFVKANYERWNNQQTNFSANGTPGATLQNAAGQCFSAMSNTIGSGFVDGSYSTSLAPGSPVSCLSPLAGTTLDTVASGALPAIPGAATAAGANWLMTQNIAPDANRNTVSPLFYNASLQDDLHPSDRLDLNLGVRFESYGYRLGNYGSPSANFWFNQINQTACVDPIGLVQVPGSDFQGGKARSGAVPQAYPGYYTTLPGQPCSADPLNNDPLFHPGTGGVPLLTLGSDGTITHATFSPRVGFTYDLNPQTVVRFSYGRYTQPTQTASEQVLTYLDGYQMANNLYNSAYFNNGFASIIHDNPIQFSNNWDASLEKRLKGTDVSFKLSPFYRYTTNQSVSVSLPGGLSGSFNSGTQKTEGVELAIQKGDPSRNGFAGQLAYTYTNSKLKYSLINGSNIIAKMVSGMKNFYGLTKNGGGSQCYDGGAPADCATDPKAVANPYYNLLSQYTSFSQLASQFPTDGYYPTYANIFPYGLQAGDASTALSPNIVTGFISYKHNRLATALTGQLLQGTQYGAPLEIAGLDPRSCTSNQGNSGIVPGSQLADYQTCGGSVAIPNPTTGNFDGVGAYREPWEINLGAQISYDISSRVRATVSLANILTRCFGGSSTSWSAAYPPNNLVCGYFPNAGFLGWTPGEAYNTAGAGYYYGNSPHDTVNGTAGYPKVFDQVYAPGQVQIASPFQASFQLDIKM